MAVVFDSVAGKRYLCICILYFTDFTSVNSFQDEVKFSSASFYNLTPPPPPVSRPPAYDVQNYQTPTKTANGTIPSENYYAATDIIKVRHIYASSETYSSLLMFMSLYL